MTNKKLPLPQENECEWKWPLYFNIKYGIINFRQIFFMLQKYVFIPSVL